MADLLTDGFGLHVPPYRYARLDSADLVDLTPTEYRADAVVVLAATQPVLAVVVEAQLGRDKGKRWSWPVYLATLRARRRCPTVLLVVCLDAGMAAWCAKPIYLGPGFTLKPTVLGPDLVPLITDADAAASSPELSGLSALAHGDEPGADKVLEAFFRCLSAVRTIQPDDISFYSDLALARLPVRHDTLWRHS